MIQKFAFTLFQIFILTEDIYLKRNLKKSFFQVMVG